MRYMKSFLIAFTITLTISALTVAPESLVFNGEKPSAEAISETSIVVDTDGDGQGEEVYIVKDGDGNIVAI